ncbi:MAG TPA: hypothetical protein VFE46_01745 [Pirellulales bacterium]|nr:hypothetical protein [Pirellulales bacterium]
MNKKEKETADRPIHERRLGHIRVTCWQNFAEGGRKWYTIVPSRRYRDGDQWKEAFSFNGLADMAILMEAIRLVADWLAQHEDETAND